MSALDIRERLRSALGGPPNLWVVFIVSLTVYLLTAWLIFPVEAPWTADEGAKYLQMTSLRIEGGRLVMEIPYPGRELDPDMEFAISGYLKDLLSVSGEGLAFERLPIFTLAVWPLERWMGDYGLYLLPAVAGTLCSVLGLTLLQLDKRWSLMWVGIAFGSPIFIYSALFWEHTLASCLALGGMLVLVREASKMVEGSQTRSATWIVGGLTLGTAVYIRLEILLLSTALLAACWLVYKDQRRWVLLASVTLLIMMLPYRSVHRAFFEGQPMPANARYLNLPLAHVRTVGWRAIPDLLVGPPEEEGIDAGWLGGVWAAAGIAAVAFSFVPDQTYTFKNLKRMGLALSGGVAAYFLFTATPYRSAHGLLFTTPWALVGFTRAREIWMTGNLRMRVIIGTAILGLGAYTLAVLGVRASSPQGGLEWGARFALTFYPLMALIAGWEWKSQPRFDRVLIVALILLGVGFQARGLATIRQDKEINADLNQAITYLPEAQVLTDLWWLTLNAAPMYGEAAIYTVNSPAEGADWVTKAVEHGLDRFALVTLDHGMPAHIGSHLRAQNVVELRVVELIQVEELLIYRLEIILREEGV